MEKSEKTSIFEKPVLKTRIRSANVKLPEVVFGYLIGPFGAMLAGGIFSSFLNKYWTEVLFADQLTDTVNTFLTLLPMLSAILIVAGNLFAGQLIERTMTKAGKARPWILLSAVTVAVTSVLMFICPSDNATVKMVMMAISYNLYYALASPLYTTANSTMISVSTRNGKQRSLLGSASNMASLAVMGAGSMVFPVLLGLLITETTSNAAARTYWLIIMIVVAVITFVCAVLQYYFTRERITEERYGLAEQHVKIPMKKQVRSVVTDRFWWIIILFYLFYQFSGALKNMSMTYFTANVLDNSFWGDLDANTAAGMTQTLLAVLGAVPMAVAALFVWPLSNKIGKQKLTIIGMVIGVAGGIIAGIWSESVVIVAVGVAMKCLGSAPAGYLILSMISESLDHIEAKNGIRADGFTMSIYSSIMVASTPIAQALFNAITTSGTNAAGITVCYIWIETFAYAACAVILLFFVVEKHLKKDRETVRARQKAEAEAQGIEWVPPEERMRREEEEAEMQSELARIEELKQYCEKKGLSFEDEEAKYQEALALKAEKQEAKRAAKEAKRAEREAKKKK